MTALEPTRRITLLREVATGPLSAMFVGLHERELSRRLVAVKVLRHRSQRDVEKLMHLRDSARRVSSIGHRHIVAPFDIASIGGFPAILSPYVEGIDLLDWVEVLRETGTLLPGRVVCEILRGAASALDAAHNRAPAGSSEPIAAVHRDLKPTNVMVDRDGELKIIDFGAGFTSLAGRDAHRGALQKGLIKYMSPERREGHRASPAADIYSLGILGIELFRGRWLRRLRSQNPAHDRHLAEVVATMGELGMRTRADDGQLRGMLLRMVAFDVDARPEAAEVAHTFRTLADRSPGPTLESFAVAHALPWLEPVPVQPDPGLEEHQVGMLETGATSSDLPVPEGFQTGGLLERQRDNDAHWEETQDGWKQSDFGDETGRISLDLQAPQAPDVAQAPEEPSDPGPPDETSEEGIPRIDTEWEEAGPATSWEQDGPVEEPASFYDTPVPPLERADDELLDEPPPPPPPVPPPRALEPEELPDVANLDADQPTEEVGAPVPPRPPEPPAAPEEPAALPPLITAEVEDVDDLAEPTYEDFLAATAERELTRSEPRPPARTTSPGAPAARQVSMIAAFGLGAALFVSGGLLAAAAIWILIAQ